MTLNIADRVQETTNTIGTGTLTLLGASPQFTTFSAAVGNGNTTYYSINDGNGIDWEVGLGTVSAGTLTRDTVYSSSNSNSSITLSSSIPHKVFATAPAVLLQGLTSSPTAFPITAAGTTQSVGQMTVTGTNAGIAIVPNGTGALMLSIPDGTTTGGNARGPYSIDLQTARSSATQVASGSTSIVIGQSNTASTTSTNAIGTGNNVSGQNSSAMGTQNSVAGINGFATGYNNHVNGDNSAAFGTTNYAYGSNSYVFGNAGDDRGTYAAFVFSGGNGRAQVEEYIFQGYVGGGDTPFVLTTNGSGPNIHNVGTLGVNCSEIFYIELIVNDRGNGAAVYTMGPGLAWRGGGNMTMGTGNPTFILGPTAGSLTWCVMSTLPTITADTTNQGYTITITPNTGNPALLVCTARLRAVWAF